MITFPPAKINIGLRVTGKRPDGYHDLQTLFVKIPLYDALEIIPSEQEMQWDGTAQIPEDNLVIKAYRAVQRYFPSLPAITVFLRKRIPMGSGLGGGSSDATATIKMLNSLFELGMDDRTMHTLASSIGADCPFFLKDSPHIGEGIGEILEPFPLDLTGYYLTLVFPGLHISTREAYAGVIIAQPDEDLRVSLRRPISEWKAWIHNDFEKSLFSTYPVLAEIKETLYEAGALFASLSGSGSAMYGISRTPLDIHNEKTKTIRL